MVIFLLNNIVDHPPVFIQPLVKSPYFVSQLAKARISDNSSRFICIPEIGRLGNRIFEFASGFGVALSKNMTLVVLKRNVVNSVFDLKVNQWLTILEDDRVCKGAKVKHETLRCGFDANITDVKPDGPYILKDYLQSWKYFNCCVAELRRQLVFRPSIKQQIDNNIEKLLRKFGIKSRTNVTLIGVHVRRGDMRGRHQQQYGFQVANGNYLRKAVHHFSNYTNKVFIVCSDDSTWPRKNMPEGHRVEYIHGNAPEVDLGILSASDHVISTVGTFGWWAGFLSGGTVIYYKWPAKEGTTKRKRFGKDYSEFFLPQWIGL